MYLTSKFVTITKEEISLNFQKDRVPLEIVTVCRQPYKTMHSFVNKIYTGTTIREIITDLASEIGADVEYDSDGENTIAIDQICIPPTTFYKIIKEYNYENDTSYDGFLDRHFGLFAGIPAIFCQHDNTVKIKNLTKKMKKAQTFTVYQLAQSGENKDIIEKSTNGEIFYTYDNIDFQYSGNVKFAVIAPKLKHIVTPKDKLFHIVEQDLATICSNYGLIDGDDQMEIDSEILSPTRISYNIQDSGTGSDETQFISRLSGTMADLNALSLNLERNLPILNLMDVGECVKLNTKITEYIDLAGKYILWSSDLNFGRHNVGEFQAVARINLIRTNKKIGQKS